MKPFCFLCLFCFLLAQPTVGTAETVGPWNLTELKKAPAMRWLSQTGAVHSLLYAGEKFKGTNTEVFAFYASPITLGEAKLGAKYPGVVLIHGGGGTAFAEWVHLWAKRGYAAIAMDLAGSRPIDPIYDANGAPVLNQAAKPDKRTRLPNGGPDHGHAEKFESIGGDVSDDWPYHAAASVIRAHSLLRSFPEVLAERTAVTGISWGGYTTCLVASLDDRFKAAVPVYGCGFLFEGENSKTGQVFCRVHRDNDRVFLRSDGRSWFITLAEIRLFEPVGNYTRVCFGTERVLIHRTLQALEARLSSASFFRANRAQIINLRAVEHVEDWFSGGLRLTLTGGDSAEISRRRAAQFRQQATL